MYIRFFDFLEAALEMKESGMKITDVVEVSISPREDEIPALLFMSAFEGECLGCCDYLIDEISPLEMESYFNSFPRALPLSNGDNGKSGGVSDV